MTAATSEALKGLQTRIAKTREEIAGIDAELLVLHNKKSAANGVLTDLRNQAQALIDKAKEPVVTEHALLRYCERVLDVDLDNVRRQILTPKLIEAIDFAGTGRFKLGNGIEICFRDRVVTSIITPEKVAA
jgi:hypothetical protein